MNFKRLFTLIRQVNLKTIVFNLTYFDFRTAMHLPVLLHRKTKILSRKGSIVLPHKVKFGMVRFGYGGAAFDLRNSNSIFQLDGTLIFKGSASFGNGIVLSVLDGAEVTFGNSFLCSSNTKIISREQIEFGDNCMLSWSITIMDTDFHAIKNNEQVVINPPAKVTLGDNVWIGCHSFILKGVNLAPGVIIAANSTIGKSVTHSNSIVGSSSQRVLREDISWQP